MLIKDGRESRGYGGMAPHLTLIHVIHVRFHRVDQELGDGHGADAAGDRGHGRGHAREPFVIAVSDQTGFGAVDADVDDHGSGLDHVGRDELGDAHGGQDDVRAADFVGDVGRAGVADGHRGVFLQEHQRQGLADNVAAADDHGLLAGHGDVIAFEQGHDSGRSAGAQTGQAQGQTAHVHGMEAVHVLGGIDQVQAFLAVQALGQGQLQEDAVNGRIGVQVENGLFQFGLGDVGGQADAPRDDARLGAAPFLVADIDLGGRVLAHQDDGQARSAAVAGGQGRDLLREFLPDGRGCRFSINN